MSNNKSIAIASPMSLFWRASFWSFQTKGILYFLVAALFVLLLFPKSVPAKFDLFDSIGLFNWFFTFFILGLLAFGSYLVLRAVCKLEMEKAYAGYIREEVTEKLRLVESGNEKIHISALGSMLPENVHSVMARMFNHIVIEVEARKFESSLTTMQPYKEEIAEEIMNISGIIRISLQLGVLGTFLGLVVAFDDMSLLGQGDSFKSLAHALRFAFSTSIAGLMNAVVLGILIKYLRNKQNVLFKEMEKSTQGMLALAHKSINNDDLFVEFRQVKESVNQLSDRVNFQTLAVSTQTAEIKEGINSLANARSELDVFLAGIRTQEMEFMEEMKGIYKLFSPENLSVKLQESLEKTVLKFTDSLRLTLHDTLVKYQELNTALNGINNYLQSSSDHHANQLQTHTSTVLKSEHEIVTALERMGKAQEGFVGQINSTQFSDGIRKSILQAGDQIANRYRSDLQNVLPQIQQLVTELKTFNNYTTRKNTIRQSPIRIWRGIVCWVSSIFTHRKNSKKSKVNTRPFVKPTEVKNNNIQC